LEEEIRMNPCTVQEMFEAANTGCAFNSYNINQRKHELEENPVYKRKVIFYRNEDTQKVQWRDITDNEKIVTTSPIYIYQNSEPGVPSQFAIS
jgi:hypothetical protein